MSIKLIFASTAALALIAGAPAHAAKGQGQQSAAGEGGGSGAKSKDERKSCRYFDNSANRTDRTRVCLTRAEWKKFDQQQAY